MSDHGKDNRKGITIPPHGEASFLLDLPPEVIARLEATGEELAMVPMNVGCEVSPGNYQMTVELYVGADRVGQVSMEWTQKPGTPPCMEFSGVSLVRGEGEGEEPK